MRVQQIQHFLRFEHYPFFAEFLNAHFNNGWRFYTFRNPGKADFYKICYTNLAQHDSKIYLVKTVAKQKPRFF